MTWLGYTLLAVLAYSFYYVFSRIFLKQKSSDATSYAILFNIVCTLLLAIVLLFKGFAPPDIKHYAANLALMGLLYAASQVLIFQASKTIEASDLIILSSTRVLWAIAAAILFLGESFTLIQAAGTALILFSAVLITYRKKSIRLARGHVYAAFAGACLGIGFVNDAYILRHADAFSYAAITFALPTLLLMATFPSAAGKIKKQLGIALVRNAGLLGFFYTLGILASYAAYQHGGTASQIIPIGQSVVIATVLLAAIFVGERSHMIKKLVASVLVAAGVILLS